MSRGPAESSPNITPDTSIQKLSRSITTPDLVKRPETAFPSRKKLSAHIARAQQVYGRSQSRGTQLTSSKSTIRLNSTFTANSRPTTAALRRKSDKEETPKRKPSKVVSQRFLEEMRTRTATCKSDFLELQRDIATYEYKFLQTTPALPVLLSHSEFAPKVVTQYESFQSSTLHMIDYLQREVQKLSKIEQKYTAAAAEKPLLKPVNYQLRTRSAHGDMRVIFKGAREVSGQCCFLQVHSNGWLTAFKIYALMLTGTHLKLKFSHSVSGVGSDLCTSDLSKRIDFLILQRLYVTGDKESLALRYHPDHGKEFLEFAVYVKKCGYVPVQIRLLEGRIVIPEIEDLPLPDPFSLKSLIKQVTANLHLGKSSLVWSTPAATFAQKEATSALMDPAYITEKLGSALHAASFITEIELGQHKFSIELHTRGGVEKVSIGVGEDIRELQDIEELRGLQFVTLRSSWTTVLQSLELQLAIKKLFPEMFV